MIKFPSLPSGKRLLFWLTAVLAAVILYLVLGVLLPYRRQPEVSQTYMDTCSAENFRSDTVSSERACIIEDNTDALVHRLRLIREAKERIILSTFDFRPDESGRDVLAALMDAAGRGVDVKVVVDGFSAFSSMNGDPYFLAAASADNLEIRVYNPVNLLTPWKLMGRLHDKYLIADDSVYLLGGRNTYDYFLGDNGYKNYDRDVLVYNTRPEEPGPSMGALLAYFDSVWNYKECRTFGEKVPFGKRRAAKAAGEELSARYGAVCEKYPAMLESCDYEALTFPANRITLLTGPIHTGPKEPEVFFALTRLMAEGKERVMIHTPYVICNNSMYDALREICSGPAEVSMMTNSVANNGNPFGASDYRMHKGDLLDTGLDIYEYEGGVSYHGKSIVVDDDLAAVGSFNLDMRSVYLDTELMLVIESREVAGQLKGYMEFYEASAVRALADGSYEIPDGVIRQPLSLKRRLRIELLSLVNGLRFLF